MKNFIYLILAFLFLGGNAMAQEKQLTGLILDEKTKEPLVGATLTLPGATHGTVTDAFGRFTLGLPPQSTEVTVSYIGYKSMTLPIDGSNMVIKLKQDVGFLNEVIVSANREKQQRTEVPVALSTLSPQVIEETHAVTLDQVLNKAPGVFIADLGNEQHMTSIRQPISTKGLFLFLEDGLPTRPTGVFNHNAMNELNMAAIRNIEVLRGPASSTYGAEAIGGVINILTHNPSSLPTSKITLQGNSNGVRRVDYTASNTFGKTGVFFGGYYTRTRNGWTEHSDMDKFAGTLKVTHRLSPQTDVNFSATLVDHQTDMSGSLDSTQFFGQDYGSVQTFTERTVDAFRIQSTINHDWNDNANTKARLFFRDNAVGQIPSYQIRVKNNVLSGTINERSFTSYGTVIQHAQKLHFLDARWIGGLSIDYSPTAFFEDYILVNQNGEGIFTGYTELDSTLTNNEIDLFNTGFYTSFDFSPVKKLRISTALRYDRFHYDHTNFLEVSSFSGSPDSKDTFNAFTPKLGFTYDFGKDRGVYANFAQGFVPPQVGELYRGVTVPVLEPSVYLNYEVGGWFGLALAEKVKGYADLSFYRLNATNQIISVLLDDGSRQNRNAGETQSHGFEYLLRLQIDEEVELRFSGTLARHEFVDYVEAGNNYNGNELAQGAHVIYNWEATYRPRFVKGLRISLENQYVGPYWMNNANDQSYEGFRLFNTRIGYQFKSCSIWGNVLNLTDELWSTRANASRFGTTYTPGIPRTYQLGITYHLLGE